MAGTRIDISLADDAVQQAIGGLAAAGDDMTPLMREFASYMEARTEERFETETAPGGDPWPPSIRALVEGGQTLTQSARLRQSITSQVTATSVTHGTNVIYAAIHQVGGVIEPVNADFLVFDVPGAGIRRARRVTIPPRPFVGIDDVDLGEFEAIAIDYLADAAGVAP